MNTNLVESLTLAAANVPRELEQAMTAAESVLELLDDFNGHASAEHERVDPSIAAANESVSAFGEGCRSLESRIDEAVERLRSELAAFEASAGSSRAEVEERAATVQEGVGMLTEHLEQRDSEQQDASDAVEDESSVCRDAFADHGAKVAAAFAATRDWLATAAQAVDEAKTDFDALLAQAHEQAVDTTESVEQVWSGVSAAILEEGAGFALALTNLSGAQIDGAVTSLREQLESDLSKDVESAVEAAVAELRRAIETVISRLGDNTGVLREAKELLEGLFGDMRDVQEGLESAATGVDELRKQVDNGQ